MASTAKREANMWLSVKMGELLEARLGKLTRARLDRVSDPEKRERLRREMLQREFNRTSPARREEMFDEIVNAMPRRLRRALGDRSYSQAGRHMAVPHRDAKRSRDVRAARARGDGPGMTNPHGYEAA